MTLIGDISEPPQRLSYQVSLGLIQPDIENKKVDLFHLLSQTYFRCASSFRYLPRLLIFNLVHVAFNKMWDVEFHIILCTMLEAVPLLWSRSPTPAMSPSLDELPAALYVSTIWAETLMHLKSRSSWSHISWRSQSISFAYGFIDR